MPVGTINTSDGEKQYHIRSDEIRKVFLRAETDTTNEQRDKQQITLDSLPGHRRKSGKQWADQP